LPTSPQSIINGTDCATQNTTASVLWLHLLDASGATIGFCSSTVIESQWVLTAAHCLDEETRGAKVDLGSGPFVYATELHYSPLYNGTGSSSLDVGVVKFSQPLGRNPMPLLLSRDATVGEQGVIAGYGQSATGSIGTLRAGFVNVSEIASSYVVVTTTSSSASTICSGDSGGPLLVQQNGAWAIAGITSSATAYCVSNTSYFARVRNSQIASFIQGYVPGAASR
jgi:secreted trypsin-like serine protease